MEEWAKVVSQETEPMRVTAWGGHIWWLTYPAVTGSKNLTTAIIFPGTGASGSYSFWNRRDPFCTGR